LKQRIGLRIHLILCKWCRRYGRQIGFLRSAAKQQLDHEDCLPEQSLRAEARERMKRALQEGKK
jgi:predicted anti-sigma-YlaC factor YlaD